MRAQPETLNRVIPWPFPASWPPKPAKPIEPTPEEFGDAPF